MYLRKLGATVMAMVRTRMMLQDNGNYLAIAIAMSPLPSKSTLLRMQVSWSLVLLTRTRLVSHAVQCMRRRHGGVHRATVELSCTASWAQTRGSNAPRSVKVESSFLEAHIVSEGSTCTLDGYSCRYAP